VQSLARLLRGVLYWLLNLYISTGLGSILAIGRELHDMAMVVSAIGIIIVGLFYDKLVFLTLEQYVYVR